MDDVPIPGHLGHVARNHLVGPPAELDVVLTDQDALQAPGQRGFVDADMAPGAADFARAEVRTPMLGGFVRKDAVPLERGEV